MTQREILVDDLQNMEDVLLFLAGVSNRRNLTEKDATAMQAQALHHILNDLIKQKDKERSNQ